MTVIDTEDDLRTGLSQLQEKDPRFVAVLEAIGEPPLRRRQDGFESLVDIIVSQQVSRASADAITARMRTNLRPYTPQGFLQFSEKTMADQGLSRPKIRTFRALSTALCDGKLELHGLRGLEDERVMAALTAVRGIGPWTAEIYLLTCLGRADIWPAGDLALQSGVQMICNLKTRPNAEETRLIASAWAPWRAVAARITWSYYAHVKQTKLPVN